MVSLTSSAAPERSMSVGNAAASQTPQDDGDPVPSSPEETSDIGDEEALDGSGSESADEATSEEEGTVNEGESGTPEEPAQRQAPPRTPSTTSASPDPTPFIPASHGPLPRMRPLPRVSAAPQSFIPPPLPPGLQATAELMAFTQELFNVVGRYQS